MSSLNWFSEHTSRGIVSFEFNIETNYVNWKTTRKRIRYKKVRDMKIIFCHLKILSSMAEHS